MAFSSAIKRVKEINRKLLKNTEDATHRSTNVVINILTQYK